ncbi:cardiolipin synthase ClsB [Uliginosibacterium gangwonense]|uniref:cardiolipin synthase ClsB n=1 Tax=Uliginosibacterium gangwonense TaxID=392736 RepID=UPI000363AE37|nr:cardiolipin synthase ClsB [Uliginosibacterium gangwonense]
MSNRVRAGNKVSLLQSGTEYFPALLEAIDAAHTEVLLETYIFAHDATADRIATALRNAAMRGVTVRLMVDGFGGRGFVHDTMPDLAADGVEVLIFRREASLFSTRRQRLRRLHRKLACVDGQLAFVGGINIIDDLDTPGHIPPRFDYAVRIEGPLVADVQYAMIQLWRRICWANFRRHPPMQHWVRPSFRPKGSVVASLLIRDNLRYRATIENAYLDMLATASDEILIANAYFLPGRRFRHALISAAKRGVRVTLLLQGRVEYWLLHHATRALYPYLLSNKIRIFEYKHGFLHAKVAIADGWWATVGSSNIDPFSLLLAREANIVIHDSQFAQQLGASLNRAIQNNTIELQEQDWQHQPLLRRLLSWFALGAVRLMLGLAGFRRLH